MKTLGFFIATFTIVLTIGTSTTSCKKDKTQIVLNDCPDTISYSAKIAPLINQSCATTGCHAAGFAAGGYNLEGHANVSANAAIILSVIKHDSGVVPMPIGASKLADSLIQQVQCWINQGQLNN